MEETTHDSSSSSRKSEEKCPPAGGIKMKIGGFKTGHCYHKPSDAAIQQEPSGVNSAIWLPRLSQDDFDRVVQTTPSGLLAVSDAEGRPGTSKILRPQLDQCPDLTDIYLQADVQTDTHAVSEMRLLSVDKNAAMWNDCFKEHASREDTCILPHFEVHEKKFGLCWQQSLSCTACHYKSRMYKLYSEVNTGSRGQKPCAPNVAIHVGLQDTTMETQSCDTFCPQQTHLPQVEAGCKGHPTGLPQLLLSPRLMTYSRRGKKPEINVLRGLPANAPINISMDVRYNSTSLKNSYGCGQSASQAVGTAIEWQTDKHEILGFHMENKLCKLGSSLRNQGQNVSCTGHQGCTATIRVVDPMSEYEIGRQIGVSFAQQQVGLKFVATDGDAKAFHGLQDAMPTVAAERQADTTHLGQTQF